MNERKTKTTEIRTKQGTVAYAKVADRVAEYHRDHKQQSQIETRVRELPEGHLLVTATVVCAWGQFSGHSIAKMDTNKSLEKAETVAVGRALAFSGYLATGEIATAEEMADFEERVTVSQLNGLKLKYAESHADELKGKDRTKKAQAFNSWARDVIGEDMDFRDVHSWTRDYYKACWMTLTGVSDDVPFSE